MSEEDKICVDFRMVGGKIIAFAIQFLFRNDGKWTEIIRIDTAKHGDINKEGLDHVHHFYKHKKAWYQLLRSKNDKDFTLQYHYWLEDIMKRAKYHRKNYLYNK